MKKRNYGLVFEPKDGTEYSLGSYVNLPKLEELPQEFQITPLEIKDQQSSDFCAGYGTCSMSEIQEGILFEPSWTFAKAKELLGDVDSYGTTIKSVLKVHCESGALPKQEAPFSIETKSSSFLRRIENWPDVEDKAYPYRKGSYWHISGPYDFFDNARAAMWLFRDEKRTIGSGVDWGWPNNKPIISTIGNGPGHFVYYNGWVTLENGEPAMILTNSYGEDVGNYGQFYMTRDVFNFYCDKYGAYMLIDITPEEAKKAMEAGIKHNDNWLIRLIKYLMNYF